MHRESATGPIRLGTLTPLTSAGGPYGPVMVNVAKAVADEINKAGGVLGRELQIFSGDDQTNPEAGIRAARKLIEREALDRLWADFVGVSGALVVNMGTIDSSFLGSMELAIRKARKKDVPWVLDPVGIGATAFGSERADFSPSGNLLISRSTTSPTRALCKARVD